MKKIQELFKTALDNICQKWKLRKTYLKEKLPFMRIFFLIMSLDVNVYQSILEVCCLNYVSMGIKYFQVMRVVLNQCICPTNSQCGNLITIKLMLIILS